MSKDLGDELEQEALEQINSGESTFVLATLSPDGYPNTTPVHLLIAPNKNTLMFGLSIYHRGYINIVQNGNAMISLCEKNDLNISIKLDCYVFKPELRSNEHMAAVVGNIISVKDDSTHSETISGIRYRCKTEAGEQFIKQVFQDLIALAEELE